MNEYGSIVAPGTVRFERVLPGPIERVWAHLTESEARGRWFASGPMELRVGGKVELFFQHTRLTDEPTPEKFKEMEKGISMLGRVTHLGVLEDLLRGLPRRPFWARVLALEREYAARYAAGAER